MLSSTKGLGDLVMCSYVRYRQTVQGLDTRALTRQSQYRSSFRDGLTRNGNYCRALPPCIYLVSWARCCMGNYVWQLLPTFRAVCRNVGRANQIRAALLVTWPRIHKILRTELMLRFLKLPSCWDRLSYVWSRRYIHVINNSLSATVRYKQN